MLTGMTDQMGDSIPVFPECFMNGGNFYEVGALHFKWKHKLKACLEGKGEFSASEVGSHTDCELGKWLYSEGLAKYGKRAEIQELEKLHVEFHDKVKLVLHLKQSGDMNGAKDGYAKLEPITKKVISLLSTLGASLT